jgi:hypothetical protein
MTFRRTVAVLAALIAGGLFVAGSASANSITPMCTTNQGGPFPCNDGWYTTPVELQWSVSPLPTSTPCSDPPVFSTDTNQIVECDATWSSPPNIQYPYQVRVEISSPTATATPARPPNPDGWYNAPVGISFSGSAFSGIASCSPTTTYAGPTAVNAMVSGTCTDNAGKTADASLSLDYDSVPPVIAGADPGRPPDSDGFYTKPVTFTFRGSDATSGLADCDTVHYTGPSSGMVTGGCHDRAGNYATITVPVAYRAVPAKAKTSRAASAPVLRWKRKPHASYYNVQVFRGRKKILSAWPAKTSLQLRRSWKYAGHRYRLKPGRYRWYVWPGYGKRAAARYGRMIVSRTLKVANPA